MFYGVKRYERLPPGEGENTPSPCQWIREFCRGSFLYYSLTFVLGLGLGLIVILPFLMRNLSVKIEPQPSIIPAQVFTPPIPISWVPDQRYIGFSDFSNRMWHVLTQQTESVWLKSPSQYGLGGGFQAMFNHSSKSELPSQFYHISNLHQLHCLNIIRIRYFELLYDTPSLSKISITAAEDTAYHVDHCIEYLRMTIMCGGNWEIEGNSPPGTPYELSVDPFGHPIGWGGIRSCVNWDALMTWQKQQLGAYRES